MKTIEETRRELFEGWAINQARSMQYSFPEDAVQVNGLGVYAIVWVQGAWLGFNAALDAVVIELPKNEIAFQTDERFNIRRAAIQGCRTAITSTNLGLRIK